MFKNGRIINLGLNLAPNVQNVGHLKWTVSILCILINTVHWVDVALTPEQSNNKNKGKEKLVRVG